VLCCGARFRYLLYIIQSKSFVFCATTTTAIRMLRNYTLQYGAPATDLIEPSDGFHPSQVGNELLAQEIWQWLEAKFPESIGSVNPFNEEIKRIFGDQGGY